MASNAVRILSHFQGNLWLFSWRKENTQTLQGLLDTDSELVLTFGDLKHCHAPFPTVRINK